MYDSLNFSTCIDSYPWRRKWQPTPVFLPGKFHGQRNLAGYSSWGCKELDATVHTYTQINFKWLYAIPMHGIKIICANMKRRQC